LALSQKAEIQTADELQLQAHEIEISDFLRRSVTLLAFRLRIHENLTSRQRITLPQKA